MRDRGHKTNASIVNLEFNNKKIGQLLLELIPAGIRVWVPAVLAVKIANAEYTFFNDKINHYTMPRVKTFYVQVVSDQVLAGLIEADRIGKPDFDTVILTNHTGFDMLQRAAYLVEDSSKKRRK